MAAPSVQSTGPSGVISSRAYVEGVPISARWRTGQFILIGLVALLAIWFALKGFRSPVGETGKYDVLSPFDLVGFIVLGFGIWLTTPTTWTVAATTFQEAIRRKWMGALLGFAIVMLGVSSFFTWMSPGEEQKFLRDYGVGFTVIMTLIVSIFLGVSMTAPDIERRTIFTILSKPINRREYLLGKYLGLMMTLGMNLLIMSIIFLMAYSYFVISKDGWDKAFLPDNIGVSYNGLGFDLSNLAKALILHFGNLSIIAAFAMMLSQFITGITAIILAFVAYFLGQSASYWERLAGNTGDSTTAAPVLSPAIRTIVDSIYFLLPRLDRFDVRERIVNDLPIGLNYMFKAGSSGLVYTAVLLMVAYFAFSDREF
jgi:Cu-processing system permease protein